MTLLSECNVKARKRHWCGWCATAIEPGETYYRQACAYDGRAYTWRECAACDTDQIARRVGTWGAWRDEGFGPEDAHEWATETVIYGTQEDQRAAKNYLERTNHD
jgi:hypothetical protein